MKQLPEFLEGLKIAVLCGGIGSERQISLESGRCVHRALTEAGMDAVLCDIGPDELSILDDSSVSVFFPALHGQFGEDGRLQQMLDDRRLVYTGSGAQASRIAFDKMESKRFFRQGRVDVPEAVFFDGSSGKLELPGTAEKYVIKPVRQGSSVGVSIVSGEREAIETARRCSEEFGECMIEQYICGRELTAGVLSASFTAGETSPKGGCGVCLPIIEIRPKEKFYNYHAKYTDEKTEFLFDTIEDKQIIEDVNAKALKSFEVMGLRDFARFDFILSDEGRVFALEVNTIPGLTGHSLLPMAAAKAGISMSELCIRVIESAIARKTVKVG